MTNSRHMEGIFSISKELITCLGSKKVCVKDICMDFIVRSSLQSQEVTNTKKHVKNRFGYG